MKTSLKIVFGVLSIILILSLSILSYLFLVLKNYNLDPNKLKTSVTSYEFYDVNENLVYSENLGGKNSYVKLSDLKNDTINAFIAIEDRKFYTHKGYNVKRILGASFNNLKSMSLKEGASTISQQLIKNKFLLGIKSLI